MWTAVVPAHNESGRIGRVLTNLTLLPLDRILVIANGCTDTTVEDVLGMQNKKTELLVFAEKLGIDIPRSIGAKRSLDLGAAGVLFVDGDMTGNFNEHLLKLIKAVNEGWDLALTNCYPYITYRQPLSAKTIAFRARLNRKLGLFHQLGIASPAHGPHAVSRRLLHSLPLEAFAIPPVLLTLAQQKGLAIGVATSLPHRALESPWRDDRHGELIAETIVGDCLEAICLAEGRPRSRIIGREEMLGYHPERRWDLLEEYLKSGYKSPPSHNGI